MTSHSNESAARPEFERIVDLREITGKTIQFSADADECKSLAKRFGIIAIESFGCELALDRSGDIIRAQGMLEADIRQNCVVTHEPFDVHISEPLDIRFEPRPETESATPDEEIELSEADFDTEFYDGSKIDVGEAVAQSLAVAIDPYPRGPNADDADARANISTPEDNSPFAALKDLKK